MGLRGALRRRKQRRRTEEALRAELAERARRPGAKWQALSPCRHGLYDAGSAQIGKRLYLFGGYRSQAVTSDSLDIFDMADNRWLPPVAVPQGFPSSHACIVADGRRYIYIVSGQVGPECRPAVRSGFVYDSRTGKWHPLPDLPEPRYAATMQLWRGRLHLVGGAAEDRWTACAEHWSIGVDNGRATEERWRREAPIPVPGMHRGSAVVNDSLYVMGGQQGDFMAIAGDADYTCTAATEERYIAACFRLDAPRGDWRRIRDLPMAVSHVDFSVQVVGGRMLVLGGQVHKGADHQLRLTDLVQVYDPARDRWEVAGHLPAPLKLPSTALHEGRIVVTGGQKALPLSDRPGPICAETWSIEATAFVAAKPGVTGARVQLRPGARPDYLPQGNAFDGRRILLVTHELSRTGAPMLLLETARSLIASGAEVRLACPGNPRLDHPMMLDYPVALVPFERAEELAREADLVLANTVAPAVADWIGGLLERDPFLAAKLAWWVHEIDVEDYAAGGARIAAAAAAVFDSGACRDAWAPVVALPARQAVIHPPLAESLLEGTGRLLFPQPDPLDPVSDGGVTMDREQLRRALGFGAEDFVVLCIGMLAEHKGQRMLLRSLARMARTARRPVRLVLVGFATARERKKFLAGLSREERRVLRPEWAFLARPDTAVFYQLADVHVTNSQGQKGGRGECFGRVTTEAMAHGIPVLGTAGGGTVEIISDGETGLLFPLGEAGQAVLVEKLKALMADRPRLAELGRAGKAAALERFRQEEALHQLEALLAPLLIPVGQVAPEPGQA